MKRRTSVLLEQEQYDRLERLARQRGTTVSEELREAISRALAVEAPAEGFASLVGMFSGASKPASWIDSDEFRDELARAVRRLPQRGAK
ncbi:MAG: CopG family transcriptional regulator [Dehalococcoidia bacterium]